MPPSPSIAFLKDFRSVLTYSLQLLHSLSFLIHCESVVNTNKINELKYHEINLYASPKYVRM